MTAPELDLIAAFTQVFGPQPTNRPRTYDPASDLDEDTLRRSFGGLSSTARREQRRPRLVRDSEPWLDELSRCSEGGLRDVG